VSIAAVEYHVDSSVVGRPATELKAMVEAAA